MTHETINNCPCCGGLGELREFKGMFRHGWVGCPTCGLYKNWSHDPKEAIRIWTKRVTLHVA